MVDVSAKRSTRRRAVAEATIVLDAAVRARILAGTVAKGDVFATARIAAIQAAKDTARWIPLCHTLPLSSVGVEFAPAGDDSVRITAEAVTVAATGVEMEALVAATTAALVIYDMVKAAARGARITDVHLVHKSGGRSGTWNRPARPGVA